MNYAVIDIGTNTLILLIGKVKGKKLDKILLDQACITRLGQGLTENHFFISQAMNRTREVLVGFKKKCQEHDVKKIVAVGTAACRTAANAQIFIEAVAKETKIKTQIISGDEEAEYTFLAVNHDFGDKNKKAIVADIGGGSTEIITGNLGPKIKEPETTISLPMGSVLLTEMFVRSDPISQDEFQRLQTSIRNNLADELDDFYPKDFNPQDYTFIATAGTATTLAAVAKKLKVYKPEKVHGSKLELQTLHQLIKDFAGMSVKDRQQLPGMESLRADVILAGALLLSELMRYFKQDKAVISDHGLRYGVFAKKFLG